MTKTIRFQAPRMLNHGALADSGNQITMAPYVSDIKRKKNVETQAEKYKV
jgi:hypothetical protein